MPGFVRRRPMLRAAAIGGTFAVGRSMGRRAEQHQSAEADQPAAQAPAAQAPAEQAGQGAAGGAPPTLDQLTKLSTLHEQGALTDEEFAAAKAQLLGGG